MSRLIRTSLLTSILISVAGCTCGPGPADRLFLAAGQGILEADHADATTRFCWNGRVCLDRDRLQLGVVGRYDDAKSYDPYWLEQQSLTISVPVPADLEWVSPTSWKVTHESAEALDLRVDWPGVAGRLSFRAEATGSLSATIVPEAPEQGYVAWIRLGLESNETEAFYGLGGWPDGVDHRGKLRPMQLEFDETESANNEIHVPVPLLVSTAGWGLFVESRRAGLFDVARKEPEVVEVTYATGPDTEALRVHFLGADQPLGITKRYYELTGDPLLPADWALGPWIWRDENDDQAQVLDDLQTIRSLDLATSGLWIDRPYATKVNTFDFNPEKFPGPVSLIGALNAAGLRVALWHVPYLEQGAEPYLTEARNSGYFPPLVGARLNGWGDALDLTNPDAKEWWQQLVKRYTLLGIEGFKLDYAEDVMTGLAGGRTKWQFADGTTDLTGHYDYQLHYHKTYAELLPRTGGFLLARTGRWGDQKNVSVIWPGDLDATLTQYKETFVPRGKTEETLGVGGLPSAINMGNNLGVSGFPFFGSDTGGYRHSPPDRETWLRWVEHTALSSVMQVGDSSSQVPWEFNSENGRDTEALEIYRQYARLHMRLFPYEWTLATELSTTGLPIQRPLGLAHPELGQHPWDTYLFGPSLLVAPVWERGATTRKTWLPAGTWIHWFTGERFEGGREITVEAPLGRLPLFLKAGGVIPMLRPTIDTTAPATMEGVDSYKNDPGILYFRVAPGGGEFRLWDGSRLGQGDGGNSLVFDQGLVFVKGYTVEQVGRAKPGKVFADGVELAEIGLEALMEGQVGWAHSTAVGGTLWIHVGVGTRAVGVE